MSSFDPTALLRDIDPALRFQAQTEFHGMMFEAAELAARTKQREDHEKMDAAAADLAAAVFLIAKKHQLSAGDMAALSMQTLGFMAGTTSDGEDGTLRWLRALYAHAFHQADVDREDAERILAEMIGKGLKRKRPS